MRHKLSIFPAIISIILLIMSLTGVFASAQVIEYKDLQDLKGDIKILEQDNKGFLGREAEVNGRLSELSALSTASRRDIEAIKISMTNINDSLNRFYFLTFGVFLSALVSGGLGVYSIRSNKKKEEQI